MNEPLVQTQVIPYLRELVKGGHELTLLTFEPENIDEGAVRDGLEAYGIEWHCLRYHKRPSVPATLFDIANGARFIRNLNSGKKFDILHARSHIPMIMATLARKAGGHKPKLLFDIRGFMPEEYVDAGVWDKDGAIYRNFKRVEEWLMKEADGFVILTERAREVIAADVGSRAIEVIPCCVDFGRRFSGNAAEGRQRIRQEFGIQDRQVFVHLGALGGLYLTEEIVDFLSAARRRDPSVFGLFLTQSDPDIIAPVLRDRGFDDSDFYVGRVNAKEVEDYLYASDTGLSFVKASYATMSRSPTKIPEYLACGLPVIANRGVGDTDEQLAANRVGVLVQELDRESYEGSLNELARLREDEGLKDRCIATAHRDFDLTTIGGERYRRLYKRLTESH